MNMGDWLNSRYLVDVKSRNQTILRELLDRVPEKEVLKILDLGSGIGSNFRYLQQRFDTDQNWRLVEFNKALSDSTFEYLGEKLHVEIDEKEAFLIDDKTLKIEIVNQNILDPSVANLDADLVVANAVFDLFSEQQFEKMIRQFDYPLMYFTINYNGTRFYPATDADTRYLDLYDQHMMREQDFGNAMGPRCANTMVDILNKHHYDTIIGPSDWILDVKERLIMQYLLDFMEKSIPDLLDSNELEDFKDWVATTRKKIESGNLSMKVQHDDILALKK